MACIFKCYVTIVLCICIQGETLIKYYLSIYLHHPGYLYVYVTPAIHVNPCVTPYINPNISIHTPTPPASSHPKRTPDNRPGIRVVHSENSGAKALTCILSYTRDNILQLQNHCIPIQRSVRKSPFQYNIWKPKCKHNRFTRNKAANKSKTANNADVCYSRNTNARAPFVKLYVSSLNPCSVKNKTGSLCDYITDHDFDVLALCETWLVQLVIRNALLTLFLMVIVLRVCLERQLVWAAVLHLFTVLHCR